MENKVLFLMAIVIMILALASMGIHWLVFAMPDWGVRTIGIVFMVDLAVLAYSSVRMKYKDVV